MIRKLLLSMAIALFLAVCFIFAGIFSSKVSSISANEVLLIGRDCGSDLPTMDSYDSYQFITPYLNQKAAENLAYAQQCYQLADHEQPDSCKVTTIPTLPYKVDHNAACPFPAEMCKLSSGNWLLDTGVLDSYEHFGLNTGPHVTVQIMEHCGPLSTAGFSNSSVDPERGAANYTRYYYGGGSLNYTFEVVNNPTWLTSEEEGDYQIMYV